MNLDSQQIAAVETDSRQALVLAGAGSGKTRVLTERIAYLIETQKVSPFEIMAITFTRKAAGELRERIKDRVGSSAMMTIGTIHAVALSFLKRYGDLIGLKGKHLTIYSEWESNYLLKEIAIDLGIYNGGVWNPKKGDIDETFAKYYQEGVEPDTHAPTKIIFREFMRRCKENNALTYGGILVGFQLLLPLIQNYLNFKHVLVDEIQDIDNLQWKIIYQLADWNEWEPLVSLFVVGDIDQSIFGWRGAVPEYLIDHQNGFELYKIESNYRSDPAIVEAANKLIEHNEKRIPRTMVATRSKPKLFKYNPLYVFYQMDSKVIADDIMKVLKEDLSKTAVLARTHVLLDKLSEELDALEIPHTKIGKTSKLLNTPEFRRFHSFLKLLINPFDNFSFLLIREFLGIKREVYNEIRLTATMESMSHFQVWMSVINDPQDLKLYFATKNTKDSILDIPYFAEESVNFALKWLEDNPNGTIHEYLDWLALWDIQEEIEESDGQLKLMTIHAAKGLEWPLVIIAGCNEGILPSKQSINADDVEEERRLMYVAMTRAKDSLILAVRPERTEGKNGKVYENPVSRFVGEVK